MDISILLSCLLFTPGFAEDFLPLLESDWFDVHGGLLIQLLQDVYKETKKPLRTKRLLSIEIRDRNLQDPSELEKVIRKLSPVKNSEIVRRKMLEWCKWQGIQRVIKLSTRQNAREFASNVLKASRIGDHLSEGTLTLGNAPNITIGQPYTSPLKDLNITLGGGPCKGDLCVILARIGEGKTTALVTVAKTALSYGHKVLYVTFEDGVFKIHRRLAQSILECRVNKLGRTTNKQLRCWLGQHKTDCHIKNARSRKTTVMELRGMVQECGGVDVLITDYADRFHQDYTEPRHGLRQVMEECKDIAKECNVVHWTGKQANRQSKNEAELTIEHAGESFSSMESPDVVLGLQPTGNNVGTVFFSKIRDRTNDTRNTTVSFDFLHQHIGD